MIENFGGNKSIKNCKELKDFTCKGDICTNGTNSLNKTDFEKYKEKCAGAVICTTPPQLILQAAEIKLHEENIDKLNKLVESHKQTKANLLRQVKTLNEDIVKKDKELEEYRNKVISCPTTDPTIISGMTKQINDKSSKIRDLESQIKKLNDQIKSQKDIPKATVDPIINQLKTKNAGLEQTNTTLTQQLELSTKNLQICQNKPTPTADPSVINKLRKDLQSSIKNLQICQNKPTPTADQSVINKLRKDLITSRKNLQICQNKPTPTADNLEKNIKKKDEEIIKIPGYPDINQNKGKKIFDLIFDLKNKCEGKSKEYCFSNVIEKASTCNPNTMISFGNKYQITYCLKKGVNVDELKFTDTKNKNVFTFKKM